MTAPKPASKIWLETDEGYVFGPGVYSLLKAIKEKGTLKEASQQLDMSYRYAWGLIRKTEEKLGDQLIEASKGGRQGGGSSTITELGEHFIVDFEKIQMAWQEFRDQYYSNSVVSATVIDVDGDLALKLNEPIYLPADTQNALGDEVKLKFLLV
ncbi:MAG: LysR family transcriptional regulator [Candidatus Bathyarchaeota archaeon]|nr:LysR family transcriptional regulator [Candidatus Bathyarchaeota archaeon]